MFVSLLCPRDQLGNQPWHVAGRWWQEDLSLTRRIDQTILGLPEPPRSQRVVLTHDAVVDAEDQLRLPLETGVVRAVEDELHRVPISLDEGDVLRRNGSRPVAGQYAPDLVHGDRNAFHGRGGRDSLGFEVPRVLPSQMRGSGPRVSSRCFRSSKRTRLASMMLVLWKKYIWSSVIPSLPINLLIC